MNDREQRGLALAALFKIEQVDGKFIVPSQSRDGRTYTVDPVKRHCTCPDHEDRAIKCKHMFAVEFVQTREQSSDGTFTVTKTFKVTEKVTYKQDWPKYNKAQTQEKRRFQTLLHALCEGVPEPERAKTGRKPFPMADMVFSAAFKVYSTVSTRRFTCDLEDAAQRGYVQKPPHYNSVCKFFEDARLTPILKALIVESSRPLREIETAVAADSTGFSTCRFVRWFDHKYGKTVEEREWVKVHIVCGVKTNIVTAVEIADKNAADSPMFKPLLATTAETFKRITEVSADAAYSSQDNMDAVAGIQAIPYVAFRENASGKVGGLFAKMLHFYRYQQDEFLKHYHKRSNVESTFSMIKAKFGDSVRSKCDVAMTNEVLCKLLCHNVCCLIHSALELGIVAKFWGDADADSDPAPAAEEWSGDEDIELLAWM